jgi:hypothetical protein
MIRQMSWSSLSIIGGRIVIMNNRFAYLTRIRSSEPLPVGQVPGILDEITYDPDGSMISRTKNRVEGGYASQSIEDYTYDAFNLVRGYRVRGARVPVDGQSTCSLDASLAPSDVWSYRFGPLQEREQKRQLQQHRHHPRMGVRAARCRR